MQLLEKDKEAFKQIEEFPVVKEKYQKWMQEKERKEIPIYGIIATQGDSFWVNLFDALFLSIYQRDDEVWKVYQAYDDHLPSADDLRTLKGLIITGSHNDSYDNETKWISNLRQWLVKTMEDEST